MLQREVKFLRLVRRVPELLLSLRLGLRPGRFRLSGRLPRHRRGADAAAGLADAAAGGGGGFVVAPPPSAGFPGFEVAAVRDGCFSISIASLRAMPRVVPAKK